MNPSLIRKSVEEFVNKDPKYTAGVIRKWMREKEPVAFKLKMNGSENL